MRTNNYIAPAIEEFVVLAEGVLCQSAGAGNESYGGDPSDAEIVF